MALTNNQKLVLREFSNSRDNYELAMNAQIMLGNAPGGIGQYTITMLKRQWEAEAKALGEANEDLDALRKLVKTLLVGEETEFCVDDEEDADGKIDLDELALRVYDLLRFELRIERERLARYG